MTRYTRDRTSGNLRLSSKRKRCGFKKGRLIKRMKQQQEAGLSSSSLPTPTDECPTFPSTPNDDYSTSLPKPADDSAGPSNIKPPYKMKESRKFVNVAYFVKSLQNLNNHGGDGCNFSDMHISGETKTGWNSGIQLSCNICLVTVTVWMDDPGDKPVTPQPPNPPSSAGTDTVKLPILAQKAPAKKRQPRYRKTPTPPPDPPIQQHFLVPRPLAESIISSKSNSPLRDMANNTSKQVNQPFIKQEFIQTEYIPSSSQKTVISSSAQPAAVQLLFYVEPSGSAPNLGTSVNDMIVPDIAPSQVLPVDLNLVKKEVEEESSSMEVVNDIPRLVPMSETSLDRSKTLFASELLTETGHFKDSLPVEVSWDSIGEQGFAIEELPADDYKNLRRKNWKASNFSISVDSFGSGSREELIAADRNYNSSEKLHKASHRLKREITDILSKELASYSLYPTNEMFKSVLETLIKAFPFLRDPIGEGTSCWNVSLKYRMQEIRRKAKVEEVRVNAGKQPKKGEKRDISLKADLRRKGIKKPRKGEVNYFPEVPEGETIETLMAHKEQLLNEYKKREPCKNILNQKMAVTYSLRRQDIVKNPTTFKDFKEDWPMLFSPDMLQKEMLRLVGVDIFLNIKVNLKSDVLSEVAMKTLSKSQVSEEDIVRSLPKIFKEKWSFYIEKAEVDDSTCLFSEDLAVERYDLSPHPVAVEVKTGWSIIAENVVLLETLDLVTALSCLLSIYHIFDLNYHPSGQKCLIFVSVALAEIPPTQRLPVKVQSLLCNMKRLKRC